MLNQYLHKELPYVLERKYLKFSIHVHKLHETSTRLEFNHSYWSLLLVNRPWSTLLSKRISSKRNSLRQKCRRETRRIFVQFIIYRYEVYYCSSLASPMRLHYATLVANSVRHMYVGGSHHKHMWYSNPDLLFSEVLTLVLTLAHVYM